MWKYCGSISKFYFSFLSFYHPYVSPFFFFFFSLDFSLPHTYTHYLHPLLFVFSTFHFIPQPPSLFLSAALFLYLFFFFFYLIPKHYPALSVIRNGERGRERKNRWVRWLCSAAPSLRSLCLCTFRSAAATRLPPQRNPDGRWLMSFFFFFFFAFIVMVWLILRLCFWIFILIMLEFRDVWEKDGCVCSRERREKGRKEKIFFFFNSTAIILRGNIL